MSYFAATSPLSALFNFSLIHSFWRFIL